MPMAQLIITAVTVEGQTKSEVARDYGVFRCWVQQLIKRFDAEGVAAGRSAQAGYCFRRADCEDTYDCHLLYREARARQDWLS
jgi:hypothetical protein